MNFDTNGDLHEAEDVKKKVRILELLFSIFHYASAAPLAWDVILAAFSAAFCVLLSLRCTSRIRPLIFAPAQSQVLSLFLFVDWEDGADG